MAGTHLFPEIDQYYCRNTSCSQSGMKPQNRWMWLALSSRRAVGFGARTLCPSPRQTWMGRDARTGDECEGERRCLRVERNKAECTQTDLCVRYVRLISQTLRAASVLNPLPTLVTSFTLKRKESLCLTKHHAVKTYGEVEV